MIISTLRIVAEPDKNDEILEILFSVKGPTEGEAGCISCRIFQDLRNERVITYEEVWQSEEKLYQHIRSDLYRNILAVMDMSNGPPEVKFSTISNIAGMELIKKALGYFDTEGNSQRNTGVR
ncbi:MAG: antibiotic biosynthesis monooxygenase [Deltaproteobacteria bacterium]|nr:antibiotic biosynthesis monooxygenase [Deltaproteobacteria bacterium]MBW1919423.1 antibiotic biosynthesis monooxygenase [Deltaproteobacteria bacterium]MBW1979018.1 antibiotic biosynthesis monooxygenase [Deltaproteobacteria bacterium]MBW2044577.1 antibiotic biosynthesis monooxygenase [Deltaproteobacteria bacterium]RLB80914.1 MAG: antibiotic biosynthesis monooxygenase [Deltaproteobacteria bacterium]